jgi:negative regulator of replication initiation
MKTVEISHEDHVALERLAATKSLTPAQTLTTLIQLGHRLLDHDNLFLFLAGAEFRALGNPVERYLALLAWCAKNHRSDFADFVAHQESGHRYVMLRPDEIQEVRRRNQARQISGTPFWAVMRIDPKSQRRFVRRLLEFIGCRDETVAEATDALGLGSSRPAASRLFGAA